MSSDRDGSWIDHHADYLDREREVPLCGVRVAVVLDENGKTGFSWCIDNADSLEPFQLAGMLQHLQNMVLANLNRA